MFTKVSIYVIIYLSIARVILCCAGEYNMQTNGNIRRHWAGGFTLSEILITLVILGFIGALGVPMLGQQKVKKPLEVKSKHGTIECMWLDGQVKAWVSDNEENTAGHFDDALTDGTACYFTVPIANIYVFQAVGAGGTGAAGMSGSPSYSSDTVTQSGSIPTDQGFYAAITDESVPSWVREYWDRQWTSPSKYVKYTLESPIGSSGKAVCEPRVMAIDECVDMCALDSAERCPSKCRNDLNRKGGASGYGGRVVVRRPITYYARVLDNGKIETRQQDTVSFVINTESTNLKIGDKMAVFKASGNGTDAIYKGNGEAEEGKKGEDSNLSLLSLNDMNRVGNILLTASQEGGTGCGNVSGRYAKNGLITNIQPANIQYYSQALAARAKFGLAGNAGSVNLRMLEKLPSNVQLKLVPAYNAGSTFIYMKNKDGGWDKFFEAPSGASGSAMDETIPINSQEDLPFPQKYYPNSFFAKFPNLTIASGAGYTSYIASSGYFPGKSGEGAHPIINWVGGKASRYFYSSEQGITSLPYTTLTPISGDDATCFDGSEAVGGVCGSGNNSGNPGAAIVSW